MSNYSIHIQKTKAGKYRVCLVSSSNGKLVLQGEDLQNRKDANDVMDKILGKWNASGWSALGCSLLAGKTLVPDHKFSKNSGPKRAPKKKVAKKKVK